MRRPLQLAFLSLTPLAASIALAAGGSHKVIVPKGQAAPAGYKLAVDYGNFALYRGETPLVGEMATKALSDADMLYFDRQPFNTQTSQLQPPRGFALNMPAGASLHLVQFVGPLKDQWLVELERLGAFPVQYVASNGYIVWADANARTQLGNLVADGSFLQYSAPLPSFLKFGPTLAAAFQAETAGDTRFMVTVQRYRHNGNARAAIRAMGLKPEHDWTPIMDWENARMEATLDQIRAIAELPDVFWVGEYLPREMLDEVQATIVRGHFSAGQVGPAGEGYKGWLESLNFPTTPASYAIVDVTDDGVGNLTVNSGDPTLHQFGQAANPTRQAYYQACTASNGTPGIHGHINTNIIGGYDTRTNGDVVGARFPGDYQRAQGINPWGRMGSTRIFAPSFSQANCGGTDAGVIKAVQDGGALISNNSWGCPSCAGTYDDSSQAYDLGVRDADAGESGNQEIAFIFAAGNSGPGAATVGTPGNGKNMITVGASENKREQDENGNWTDGCSVPPTGADSAMDVIDFSSRGPSPGGRKKPEVIAPGTHITGTKPTANTGAGACDPSRPTGNSTFAASSGTSHSAPAVAGVASLVDYWMNNGNGAIDFDGGVASRPTPAVHKAWLMAHPTYLTGVSANDTLPSNSQGYGMPNMQNMFNNEPKYVVNQTQVLGATGEQFTWVGAAANPARPIRIAMAYTDKPGAIGTSPQVNNLNLEVIADGTTYRGNVFTGQFSSTGGTADTANNYEAVFLPAGAASALEIRVIGANIADDGVPGNADATDQDFGLVCDNCIQEPTFTIGIDPTSYTICSQDTSQVTNNLSIGSILGFTTPVNLTLSGEPAGSTEGFAPNPVTPAGSSTLTLSGLGTAAAGNYTLAVNGVAGMESKSRNIGLTVYSADPTAATLTAPEDAANNVPLRPNFTWDASTQAATYLIEVDDNADFGSLVYSGNSSTNSHTPNADLPSNTVLFWRVTAQNTCGNTVSTSRSFTTVALPGDCSIGTVPLTNYQTGFEPGLDGWTLGAGSIGTANWAITTARVYAGTNAVLAQGLAAVSDQRLVSPAIALPADQSAQVLIYQSHQILEDKTAGGCFDGGILEISTDAGMTWTQLDNTRMLTDPYNGPVDAGFSNPIAGAPAWCEDPAIANPPVWTRSVVDINSFGGQTVQFRFRVATDSSVGRAPHGFYLDDVRVQGCSASLPNSVFADSFE